MEREVQEKKHMIAADDPFMPLKCIINCATEPSRPRGHLREASLLSPGPHSPSTWSFAVRATAVGATPSCENEVVRPRKELFALPCTCMAGLSCIGAAILLVALSKLGKTVEICTATRLITMRLAGVSRDTATSPKARCGGPGSRRPRPARSVQKL